MKDRVFIAWSGSNNIALKVKGVLERDYNYICSIGGNSDNNSQYSSVGDTVLQQIKSCNQAIVIFQNRSDGAVSNNLFFELGYVLSMYGMKKVHCVRKINEEVILPSDFDNSFIEPIQEGDDDFFVNGIVKYFISRQKMSINENKMFLINNRYILHDKIVSHYSEQGSKCSDYELAQYVLFYMQAAHMFGDEHKIQKEISEFKQAHNFEFSSELELAVNMCLSFFDLVLNIKVNEVSLDVYVDQNVFWKFKNDYVHYESMVVNDDIGIFDEWVRVFIAQHLSFAYMLFANNTEIDEDIKDNLNKKQIEYALKSLENITILEQQSPCVENNDERGIISLFRAYVYRNIFIAKNNLKENDAGEWLEKSLKERESLKNNFSRGTIDTQLFNNFCMEYYLSLVNYLSFNENIDMFEKKMYKSEIQSYLNTISKEKSENAYINQIALWCEKRSVTLGNILRTIYN